MLRTILRQGAFALLLGAVALLGTGAMAQRDTEGDREEPTRKEYGKTVYERGRTKRRSASATRKTRSAPAAQKTPSAKGSLIEAVKAGDLKRVQDLIERGADVDAKDKAGGTALHYAKDAPIARLLLKNDANANATDERGRTPLIAAAAAGRIGAAEALLKAKARIDVRGEEGRTALAEAVLNRHPRTAALLISSGANIYIQDRRGRTPRDLAKATGDENLVALLEKPLSPRPRNPEEDPDIRPANPEKNGNENDPPATNRPARYAQDLLQGASKATERSKAARRYFDDMSEERIEREIAPLLKEFRRGSLGYRSAAYALAFYGIDSPTNARRVMGNWLGVATDEPSPADVTAAAVRAIYERHPSDEILIEVIAASRKGRSIGEEASALISDLFLAYPEATLRAAATPVVGVNGSADQLRPLARALEGYAGSRRVLKTLKEVERKAPAKIARAAQALEEHLDHLRQN